MASTILESLKAIEAGRQNCIKNARLANLNPTDDMDIFNIGELFLQKNTEEYINPNTEWVRPTDWWDTETILEEAEDIDNLHPAYILLLNDAFPTITFTKTTSGKALRFDGILTSDGEWYTADNSVHTWDTTQDKPCSEGYKTRYAIIYVANTTNINKIELNQFPCLEFIAGNITLKTDGICFGASGISTSNHYIYNIKYLSTTNQDTINTSYYAKHCSNLRKVSIPNAITIGSQTSFENCVRLEYISLPNVTSISSSAAFRYCTSLKNISLPNVTSISGSMFMECSSLINVSLPKLESLSEATFNGCVSIEHLELPKLQTVGSYNNFLNIKKLTSISLPSLTRMSSSGNFGGCNNLKNISLSNVTVLGAYTFNECYSLETILIPRIETLSGDVFKSCTSLKELTIPSTIINISTPNTLLTNCYGLITLNLFQGFKFTNLNLSYCPKLSIVSLNDILDNLADVTEESSTYTLTLGTTNLGKLTAQEIAVGTDKGWVIN